MRDIRDLAAAVQSILHAEETRAIYASGVRLVVIAMPVEGPGMSAAVYPDQGISVAHFGLMLARCAEAIVDLAESQGPGGPCPCADCERSRAASFNVQPSDRKVH